MNFCVSYDIYHLDGLHCISCCHMMFANYYMITSYLHYLCVIPSKIYPKEILISKDSLDASNMSPVMGGLAETPRQMTRSKPVLAVCQ